MPTARPAIAARSASHHAVRAALTLTQAGWSSNAFAAIARAVAFAAGGTASSRSSITASAPARNTRSSSFAL
jgi:hypothetical protein